MPITEVFFMLREKPGGSTRNWKAILNGWRDCWGMLTGGVD
jgi:hypothetical protein